MVREACQILSIIEKQSGEIVSVFPYISYEGTPISSYSLIDEIAIDVNGVEHDIKRCTCYTLEQEQIKLSDTIGFGNEFYKLVKGDELKLFTGITSLGDGETYRVFNDNCKLESIDLKNIVSLPEYTLFRCKNLREIEIPANMTDIDTYAIAACDGLQSLRVNPNNPKFSSKNSQGEECNCILEQDDDKLILIQGCNVSTIPDNITDIASGAFDECEGIHSITFHPQLKHIGDNVFRNCTGLNTKVTIPSTIESIGESTFRGCTNLPAVECNVSEISDVLFKDCENLSAVTLNNTTYIGYQAFMNDTALQTITLPDTVTSLGTSAFYGCESLETVYINSNSKVTLSNSNVFSGCTNLTEIIVPDNLVATYKESEDWYEYRDIIFGQSIFDVVFDSQSGSTTPATQHVRMGGKVTNPGDEEKLLYVFHGWVDESGNTWDFEEDYVTRNVALTADFTEVKAIVVQSVSNEVTNISMSYNGSYPANVEYSFDGVNWESIGYSTLSISTNGNYNNYVYFRGNNPNGFSRDSWSNYTKFNIYNGQCDLLGNLMYLKDYNNVVNSLSNYEFFCLFQNCYAIRNCDNLTLFNSDATLADSCYSNMFQNCTSLGTAPELPATTLANDCYSNMFYGCTSLTSVPSLPATTLALGCYYCMFCNCTSLATTPELPATTLADSCYSNMFNGCTSLTTAPELPAATLVDYCYAYMFYSCRSLNYIKCLATDISASSCTTTWVAGITSTGTFVKNSAMSGWVTGNNGIPSNWTVQDAVLE